MKVGFVVLVGRSNVGKSTLLNALVGTKIAITSPKPQTTRRAVQGVLHLPEGQIIFVDTPGLFQKRHDVVTNRLNKTAEESVTGVDVLVHVVDPHRSIGPEEEKVIKLVRSTGLTAILAINKIDTPKPRFIEDYRALAPDYAAVVEVSALKGSHLRTLTKEILARLPEGEPAYPEGQVTNLSNREWYAELIREKIFMLLYQEMPYTVAVEVDDISDRETKTKGKILAVTARILVDDEKHKRMLIGKGGDMIKRIGAATRKELEAVTDRQVFLDLSVVADPHWPERLA
jgi:GTP-binding protein Era